MKPKLDPRILTAAANLAMRHVDEDCDDEEYRDAAESLLDLILPDWRGKFFDNDSLGADFCRNKDIEEGK